MTLVKICGIQDRDSAQAAVEAGADMLGFHFCSSRRRIDPELAAAIIEPLKGLVQVVGVFIDAPPEELRLIVERCGLDWVQLHGSEQPGYPSPRPMIKVLKVRDGQVPDASAWPDPIMLDAWSVDQRGGTGSTWDWDLARPLIATRQVFVAGGLGPDSVGRLVSGYHPFGVDVSSGVERNPGTKDAGLMRAFVSAVRMAEHV
ncbi:MAG TPA: phosphoribosylanthranilate isomerase [Candidatus Dormibacteraeota bacterium]|nr:phosphoribosylanthranilate isomerase [Candidatus Dormibacteraeota bacterium]